MEDEKIKNYIDEAQEVAQKTLFTTLMDKMLLHRGELTEEELKRESAIAALDAELEYADHKISELILGESDRDTIMAMQVFAITLQFQRKITETLTNEECINYIGTEDYNRKLRKYLAENLS